MHTYILRIPVLLSLVFIPPKIKLSKSNCYLFMNEKKKKSSKARSSISMSNEIEFRLNFTNGVYNDTLFKFLNDMKMSIIYTPLNIVKSNLSNSLFRFHLK